MKRSLIVVFIAILVFSFSISVLSQNQELVIGYTVVPIINTDPQQADSMTEGNFLANWAETLIRIVEGEPIPHLATSWEVDDSGLIWTFNIRENVSFHDGTPLNAEMVKQNFERLIDPETASPSMGVWGLLEEVKVVDEYTVQFVTEEPFAPFIANLAHYSANIINAKIAEEVGIDAFNEKAIGTGPFKITGFVPRRDVILEPFEDYWAGAPKLDRVTIRSIREEAAATAALITGEVDLIWRLPKSQIPIVEASPGLSVLTNPAFTIYYIGFNTEREPFDDPLVRRAISHAIDLEAIWRDAFHEIGILHAGPVGPEMWGFDPEIEGLEFDIEKAKELLAEAGYPNGLDEPIHFMVWEDPERVRATEIIQAQLEKVGIQVDIDVWEWGAFLSESRAGNMDMFQLSWSNVTGDADICLFAQFHSTEKGIRNRARIDDPLLDELIEGQQREFDLEKRQEIVSEAIEYIIELAPWISMFTDEWVVGIRDEVKGYEIPASGNFYLEKVYKD